MKEIKRIVRDLKSWQENQIHREKSIGFSLESSRPFLVKKLRFRNMLPGKYEALSEEEHLALSVVKQESNSLMKHLYPNPIIRLLHQLMDRFSATQQSSNFHGTASRDIQHLGKQLQHLGFGDQHHSLKHAITEGAEVFSISSSMYFQEQDNTNFKLNFEKGGSGNYVLESIDSELHSKNIPRGIRSRRIASGEGFRVTPERLYNLLQGRTMLSDPQDLNSALNKLDFADKDAEGQFRLKEFHNSKDSSFESILQRLPDEYKQNRSYFENLKTAPANGTPGIWIDNTNAMTKVYQMEPDANSCCIRFYDENRKQVPVITLLGQAHSQLAKSTDQSKTAAKLDRLKKPRNALGC